MFILREKKEKMVEYTKWYALDAEKDIRFRKIIDLVLSFDILVVDIERKMDKLQVGKRELKIYWGVRGNLYTE